MTTTNSLHQQLEDDGYVIVDDLIEPELLQPLKDATERVIEKARAGKWQERRIVGKQFPPWPKTNDPQDIWAVQHVMNPELEEPVFAAWYGSSRVINTVAQILDTSPTNLQLELFNVLINPSQTSWSLTWHRDTIGVDVPEEEEFHRLQIPHSGTQWNTALYEDSSFIFVPRSHRRVKTPEERRINKLEPYGVMPGEVTLTLKQGQSVFYNNNLLHRAKYDHTIKRVTLHASMGLTTAGPQRAQNLFQHGLDWIKSDKFRKTIPSTAQVLYDNLLRLGEINSQVNFDHPDDGFSKEFKQN